MRDDNPFLSAAPPVCPPDLLSRASRYAPPRMAIARAGAPAPMQSARDAAQAGIATPVFVGEPDIIGREAEALNWDISGYDLVPATGEEESAEAAVAAVREGAADVLMKGHLHSDAFLRPAIRRRGGLHGARRFVHIFHLSPPLPGRALMISDAAMNVRPAMMTRQDAIRHVTALGLKLGLPRPRIAILSATETPMASMPQSLEARALADWAVEAVPEADVSGPLAMDLVLSAEAARIKDRSDDPVAGRADAVIVPDIVTGNALFKAFVYLGGACAAGVVMGGSAPILLTSRADPPAARLASAAIASILCAKPKEGRGCLSGASGLTE